MDTLPLGRRSQMRRSSPGMRRPHKAQPGASSSAISPTLSLFPESTASHTTVPTKATAVLGMPNERYAHQMGHLDRGNLPSPCSSRRKPLILRQDPGSTASFSRGCATLQIKDQLKAGRRGRCHLLSFCPLHPAG